MIDVVTVDVPKTVVVTDDNIQVVEVAALDDSVKVITVGQQGPAGPAAETYIHSQATPASTWVIAHNLNRYPAVSVVDSSGNTIICDAQYTSTDSLTITFSASFSGSAYLN